MAQIGLAIAGRHPGYEIFSRINWLGPEPIDKDVRASSAGEVYVSAVLDADYDTYELVLCNFVSNSGRNEALRIILRTPHGYALLNEENIPVAPTYILWEVRKMLAGAPLVQLGSTVRFTPGVVRPVFPDADIAALLNRFHLEKRWGGEITMIHASGHPQYVLATEQTTPKFLGALPQCTRLKEASTVYFGQFLPSAQPQFVFYPEEENSSFKVRLSVKRHNGTRDYIDLQDGCITLNSQDFGYNEAAYQNAVVTIDAAEVANAYRNGRNSLPTPGNIETIFNPEAGEVEVNFTPLPRRRTFTVNVIGSNREPLHRMDGLLCSLTGVEGPVNQGGYTFTGEDILKFEHSCQNPVLLASRFRIAEGVNYAIEGASLIGDIITVSVRQLAPPAPAAPVETRPIHPAAPDGVHGGTLTVRIPASWKIARATISIAANFPNSEATMELTFPADFIAAPDGASSTATLPLPSDVNFQGCRAFIDVPPKAETDILYQGPGAFSADFVQGRKIGFFGRLAYTFAYKYESSLGAVWKSWRIFAPALGGLVLIIAGIIIGALMSETIRNAATRVQEMTGFVTSEVVAPSDTTTTVTPTVPEVAEENKADNADAPEINGTGVSEGK